ncbi:uncharacterized protein LOC108599077 [Drosophila busckii]|uniref:uncharacterized protein LOC108599077 n=1 Tax=Drosophila busckii TaxID=30019 RepID=UPI001432D42E|nr:uncharacterized protein LOC108599077 [Drosophila busckii]
MWESAQNQEAAKLLPFEIKTKMPVLNRVPNITPVNFELEKELTKCWTVNTADNSVDFQIKLTVPKMWSTNKLNLMEALDLNEMFGTDANDDAYYIFADAQLFDASTQEVSLDSLYNRDSYLEFERFNGPIGKLCSLCWPSSACSLTNIKCEEVNQAAQQFNKSRTLIDLAQLGAGELQLGMPGIKKAMASCVDLPNSPKHTGCNQQLEVEIEASDTKLPQENKSAEKPALVKQVSDSPMAKVAAAIKIAKPAHTDIAAASVVTKLGRQIFCRHTKVYCFDNLKSWELKGEGQLEIWQELARGAYYLLLRSKYDNELLLHMQLNKKWHMEYAFDSDNSSCIWSHYNYAKSVKGRMERLACRFHNAQIAGEFMSIVDKCIQDSL